MVLVELQYSTGSTDGTAGGFGGTGGTTVVVHTASRGGTGGGCGGTGGTTVVVLPARVVLVVDVVVLVELLYSVYC